MIHGVSKMSNGDSNNATPIETKLAAARTRLILDKPFLGALVLRLPMIAADPSWCPTTATDARAFYYNADYIAALKPTQVQFILAHEALHCALSHFSRRGRRIKSRWDVACDHAINPLLVKEGLHPPPGAWHDDSFLGMTAEEIYPLIGDNHAEQPLDKHVYDEENTTERPNTPPPPEYTPHAHDDATGNNPTPSGDDNSTPPLSGAPQPQALSHHEREHLTLQWRQRLAGAAQQALQAHKLGGDMARMVDYLLQPQLPWRMLLAHYLSMSARDDYTYMRPSRREGEAIFPCLRSQQAEICVAIDISGSIKDDELRIFISEINALKGQLRARITLLACDAELSQKSPWIFEAWDEMKLPDHFQGGGGTSFVPVFTWLERQDRPPDVLLYFTDANGTFPDNPPFFPVLWLIKGRLPVPWGQRIQLNE
jgi:predicted metal-dependent peptidase